MKSNLALTLTAFVLAITTLFAGDTKENDYKYLAHKVNDPKNAYDFTLTDPDGKPFSLRSLRGKFVLIDFGFTNCPNTCPTTLANLAEVYGLLSPKEQTRLQVLFISVDPERDTTKVLKKYVPFFQKSFIGLTGKSAQIDATAQAYGVVYEDEDKRKAGAPDYKITHSTAIYLIAPSGKCIAFYENADLRDHTRMAEDLHHFMELPEKDTDKWAAQTMGVVKPLPSSGRQLYVEQCASCHGENGRGMSGKYPSLVGSAWVTGPPNRLTALVLDGVKGKVDPNNARQSGVMPAWRTALPPTYTALILTYIRQAWGNKASAVSGPYVEDISRQFVPPSGFWSLKELEALPADTSGDDSSSKSKSSALP